MQAVVGLALSRQKLAGFTDHLLEHGHPEFVPQTVAAVSVRRSWPGRYKTITARVRDGTEARLSE